MMDDYFIQPRKRIIADRYKVRQEITGGMGIIYLCIDTVQSNIPVVLKTCKPQFLSNKNVQAQFLREAVIWVEIGWHPNIVQAYRAEYNHNTHEIYLVLAMVPSLSGDKNPTLRSWLQPRVGTPLEKTLKLMLEVTRGMKHATSQVPGLIHCDLKPENIFISPDGTAYVSDFGLVATPTDIFESLSPSIQRYINSRSKPVGTPYYMSPEQWRNRKVMLSSDIYSLGCIGLEMLTGDYTVSGRNMQAIIEGHIRGQALNRLIGVNLPIVLDAFFAKCIDPDPLYRFQSWEEVESEIIKLYDVLLQRKIHPEIIYFDVSHRTQLMKGETILSIGEAYLDIDECEAALKCFEKAKTIGKLQNSPRLVTLAEANMGLAFIKLGQHARGSARYHRAMEKHIRAGMSEITSTTLARYSENITKVME